MADTFAKKMLFNDGEGIAPADFNDLQKFIYAQLVDNLLGGGLCAALGDPANPGTLTDLEDGESITGLSFDFETNRVFCPYPSAGYFKPAGTARQLNIVRGPVLVASLDEPFNANDEAWALLFLGFTTLTTSVGDATNPRYDLVEIRKTGAGWADGDTESRDFKDATTGAVTTTTPAKRRTFTYTVAIKEGTPAATPAYPTPTAGAYVLGAIYVPAGHNAVHDPLNIRDMRWPLGHLRVYDVPIRALHLGDTNPWALQDSLFYAQANATGTTPLWAICPTGAKGGRLVGVGLYGTAGATSNAHLYRVQHNGHGGGATLTALAEFTTDLYDTSAYRVVDVFKIAQELVMSYPGGQLAGTAVATPLWCSSYPAGMAKSRSTEVTHAQLAVRVQSEDPASVHFVRFFVLEGL